MIIIESSRYKRDKKSKLLNKHKDTEIIKLNNIISFIESKVNLKEVLDDNLSKIYNIEQKHGNYPYNLIEITSIDFDSIDDHHYVEG